MINGMIFFLSIGIVLVVLSFQLARDSRWRNLAIYTRVTGILVLVLNVLNGFFAEAAGDPLHPWLGLFQRAILAIWFLCLIILAFRLWRLGGCGVVETPQGASSSHRRPELDHISTRRVPRWVIIFVIVVLLLVLTVVIIEITNNGMGNMQMAIPGHLATIVDGGQAR